MPLTVDVPAVTPPAIQPAPITPPSIQPPAITPPAIQVADAAMASALEADGYTVTAPGTVVLPPPATGSVGLWNNGTPASSLGSPKVQFYLTYADGSNSTTYSASEAAAAGAEQMVIRVGKLTAAETTEIAQALSAYPHAIWAPMWEYNNHSWFDVWNQNALTVSQFQADWLVIVNAARAVNKNFQFWLVSTADPKTTQNDAAGRSEFDVFMSGNDALGLPLVDGIGIDVYDNNGSIAAGQACIDNVSAFAAQHGLMWAIFEWGLQGNVDDPAFVVMIATVTSVSTCLFQALFSQKGVRTGSGTDITLAPNSLAAYKKAFG